MTITKAVVYKNALISILAAGSLEEAKACAEMALDFVEEKKEEIQMIPQAENSNESPRKN